jgi:hypothetical protein
VADGYVALGGVTKKKLCQPGQLALFSTHLQITILV